MADVKLTFSGDDKGLVKSFDNVGDAATDMAKDLDKADDGAGRFSRGIGGMNEKIDASESKFTGAADLVDGLAGAFGISLGPVGEYAQSFASLAGGFATTLGPALEGVSGKLSKLSVVTKAQSIAQAALNGIMALNPIFLVVAAVAALTAAFIIAYKKSETFRAIVDGAMSGVRTAVTKTVSVFTDGFGALVGVAKSAGEKIAAVADVITTPYQLAFKAIAKMWNNTVGKLSVDIPGFLGFGGIHLDVPDIPEGFRRGGRVDAGVPITVGEGGPETFVPGMTGSIVPNGAGGGRATVLIAPSGPEAFKRWIREMVRTEHGGSVQAAFGS